MSSKVYQKVKEISRDLSQLKQHLRELHKLLDRSGLIPENPINVQMFYVDYDTDALIESTSKLNDTLSSGFAERNHHRGRRKNTNPQKKVETPPS